MEIVYLAVQANENAFIIGTLKKVLSNLAEQCQ